MRLTADVIVVSGRSKKAQILCDVAVFPSLPLVPAVCAGLFAGERKL